MYPHFWLSARSFIVLGLLGLTVGCGDKPPTETAATPDAGMQRSVAPPGAAVFIISPEDGTTVTSPVTVKFGISGIELAAAGTDTPNSGHHHLLIDAMLDDPGAPILADTQHIHYGKGQTEGVVELEPGPHTLQLVLGDSNHVPHEPPIVSEVVTITVE